MPIYHFRLDVPAEVSIVAERLRAVIGNRYDRWIDGRSGAVFYGRIENNTFRIRRNIGYYRNSFLPRILGRLSPIGAATTMHVTMWMNPAVLLFMLFWGGGLAYIAMGLLAQNASTVPVPLIMLLFGVCLSLGSFYWEARKAQTLLSSVATSGGVENLLQAQQRFSVETAPVPVQNNTLRMIVWAIVAITFIPTATMLVRQRQQLTSCPAFKQSLEIASNSPIAKNILGDHVKVAGFARGFVRDERGFGYALISIPVQGSSGKGMVHAIANRVNGEWHLERVALWLDGKRKRIDLTPAVRRETFSYPTTGVVYLIPFDQQSADQLLDLPAYYAARLGLRTIVLPVTPFGKETIDPKNQQVVAERVIDFMEERARQLNVELNAVMIGVTSRDLNIKSSGWSYATNYRIERFGIVSTARLHDIPLLAGANPELLAERVRKMVTKNLALLRYPISLSADPTSVLATSVFTAADVDRMSEEFLGEHGKWMPNAGDAPCFSVTLGPDDRQTWMEECTGTPPNDSRFETFDHYAVTTSMVMSRTDFPFPDERRLSLIRRHWGKDDKSRSFGAGGNNSFGIYLIGDSHTFSWVDLIQEDCDHLSFRRTSFGTGYANAKLLAERRIANPFSKSTLEWNGNGWNLKTLDDWTYQFPSSGPGRSSEQSALIGITSPLARIRIKRNDAGAPVRIEGLPGAVIDFESDAQNRITQARHSSGRTILYKYGAHGELSAVNDSETGDEHYEYDQARRLTAVFDAKGNRELSIDYGYSGEITKETLGDGRTLQFQYRFDATRALISLVFTDDQGFVTEWTSGEGGYFQSLPRPLALENSR